MGLDTKKYIMSVLITEIKIKVFFMAAILNFRISIINNLLTPILIAPLSSMTKNM